jgi:hypothetical protein
MRIVNVRDMRYCEHAGNARKALQMRARRVSEGAETRKQNNLFFEERSHQVTENTELQSKTNPKEAKNAGARFQVSGAGARSSLV